MPSNKTFPEPFTSYEEYDGYVNCLNKVQLGDEIILYLCKAYDNRLSPAGRKTAIISQPLKVVGKKEQKYSLLRMVPVLGMSNDTLSFWRGEHIYRTHDIKSVADNINSYSYFRICTPSDTLVAKIIRQSRP